MIHTGTKRKRGRTINSVFTHNNPLGNNDSDLLLLPQAGTRIAQENKGFLRVLDGDTKKDLPFASGNVPVPSGAVLVRQTR